MKKIGKTSKLNKIVKTILSVVVILILSIAFNIAVNMSQAFTMYAWNGLMPSSNVASITGYFPQSYEGGIVLCNDNQTVVRWGSKDYAWYYPSKDDYNNQDAYESATDEALLSKLKNRADALIDLHSVDGTKDAWYSDTSKTTDWERSPSYKAREYPKPSDISVTWTGENAGYGDASKPLIAIVLRGDERDEGDWNHSDLNSLDRALKGLKNGLEKKLNELSKEVKPGRLKTVIGYDSEYRDYNEGIETSGDSFILGPQVAVSGTGTTSAYSKDESLRKSIDTRTSNDQRDIMTAYIYSGEYHYKKTGDTHTYNGQNTEPYNLTDVQVANWICNDDNHRQYSSGARGTTTLDRDATGSTITQGVNESKGMQLYQEAWDYYQFITSLKANGNVYQATVNTGDSQIFVSRGKEGRREEDEYVIGPVSITYPYYKNVSYMTDIVIDATNKDGGSASLSYKNGDFKIVIKGTALTGGTIFPGESVANENFYIIINAAKAAYPDEISIRGEFEYTDYCKTTYETWYPTGGIQIYRYIGLTVIGSIEYNVTYYSCKSTATPGSETHHEPEDGYYNHYKDDGTYSSDLVWHKTADAYDWTETWTDYTYENRTEPPMTVSASVIQGVIFMDTDKDSKYKTVMEDAAQEVRKITYVSTKSSTNTGSTIVIVVDEPEPSSSQTTYAHKASAKAEAKLDLTIKLGGKVWLDGTAGKESAYDGQFNTNTDTPMSNVTVKLHQRKPGAGEVKENDTASVKATTKTDGNGNYSFENLNALYTYWVEFVYNGQYYQPTTYTYNDIEHWNTSSKGTDNNTERDNFNARFEEIGSYPHNYSGGKVYTRDDLVESNAIDDYGNPTGNGTDEQKNFVNDCMMSSYTGYNSGKNDYTIQYYPVYTKFVYTPKNNISNNDTELENDSINNANKAILNSGDQTTDVKDSSGTSIRLYFGDTEKASEYPYYGCLYSKKGKYSNLHINQGYVLRETADLAARKDVLKVTTEMNGKSQTYKYDKNSQETDSNGNDIWTIDVRMSDGYYSTNYTRELYKEDFYRPKLKEEVQEEYANAIIDGYLKVYVTYKIRIKNQSGVLATAITEIVDYYDDEYTLIGSDNKVTSEQKYKPYIGDSQGNKLEGATGVSTYDVKYDQNGNRIANSGSKYYEIYGESVESDITGYKKTYIRTDSEVKIPESGGSLYIYITFKVNDSNKNGTGTLILDDGHGSNDKGKSNIIEINGYKTYYSKLATAPNKKRGEENEKFNIEYSEGDIAGIVDVDSVPGNLNTNAISKDIQENGKNITFEGNTDKYNIEDDTDLAPSMKIKLYDEGYERELSGTVWEDSRNLDSNLAKIGDGTYDATNEKGIGNVKVELIDMARSTQNKSDTPAYILVKESECANYIKSQEEDQQNFTYIKVDGSGETYYWVKAVTTTQSDGENTGNYLFTGYVPSNYVVKFTYGIEGTQEDINDGKGRITYNGQDYKSTSYHTVIYDNATKNYNVDDPDNNSYAYAGTVNYPTEEKTYNLYGAASNKPSTTYFYDLQEADSDQTRHSDARDIMGTAQNKTTQSDGKTGYKFEQTADITNKLKPGTRTYVNTYSNNKGNGVTNSLAQELKDTTIKDTNSDEYIVSTWMVAQSGQINVEIEYDRTETGTADIIKGQQQDNAGSSNTDPNKSGYYHIDNLDFGLVERPKAQIKVTKQVANVKVTLANGNTLFDATKKATNVMWLPHTAHGSDTDGENKNTDTANTYNTSNNYYEDKEKSRIMMKVSTVRKSAANKGSIQLTMDEELMHGSTLQITYIITAANIGEVDYLDNKFYYKGETNNTGIENISRTSPDLVIDYVGTQVKEENSSDDKNSTRNNLQFSQAQNSQWNWKVATQEELDVLLSKSKEEGRSSVRETANKYTTIITTDALKNNAPEGGLIPILADQSKATQVAKALEDDPLNALDTTVNKKNSTTGELNENGTESVVGTKLVLTQTLTQDSPSDSMAYNNMVELVTSSNTVGRRMTYSVVGNQDPTLEPKEIDADDAQEVKILPPYGQTYIHYILGIVVAVILIIGVTAIIVVFKKNRIKQ